MKRFLSIVLGLVWMVTSVWGQRNEYPRPQFERTEWINLNGTWTCQIDPAGSGVEKNYKNSKGFDQKIIVPFSPESKLSGVGHTDFIEHLWYHRLVNIPAEWKDKKIMLNFGGVYYESEIYIDGQFVDRHFGGSSSFSVDLTDFVRPGHEHSLVVYVKSDLRNRVQPAGKQSTRHYSFVASYTRTTGIWQTVWMEAVHPKAIKSSHVITDIDNSQIVIQPEFYGLGNTRLRVSLKEKGRLVAQETSMATENAPIVLNVKKARLWSPDSPFLYDLDYEVLDEKGNIVDKVHSYTGMRKIHYEGNRLYLNNRPLYLRMVLDQGFYPESQWTAPSDSALKNDILLAKAAGFNGARLHQKVFEERFHYWADQLGYLTCGEMNSWGLDYNLPVATSIFLPEWMEIVKRDRNHPSIIMWVPLNEQNNVDKYYFPRFSAQLYDATKLVDSTRPVLTNSGGAHYKTDIVSSHLYIQDSVSLHKELWNDGKLFPGHRFNSDPNVLYNTGANARVDTHETRWMVYEGSCPYLFDEFGGISFNTKQAGWGYGGSATEEEFYKKVGSLVNTVVKMYPFISGYCYTQLTDVEQEQNGLYYYDRKPKFDVQKLKEIFGKTPVEDYNKK